MEINERVEKVEKTRCGIAESNSSSDNSKILDDEDKTIGEKLMKVNAPLKPPVSPTSLLAKNIALLPSGVAKVKQQTSVPKMNPTNPGSSLGSATGNPRNKTALAPGHSLMDWIRLGASGIDMTGVGGVQRSISPAELARHNKPNDAWLAIRGIVYNVTRYMDFHPGGKPELMKGVGKDATKLFDDVHAWVNYQSILQKCVVGRLNRSNADYQPASAATETAASLSSSSSSTFDISPHSTEQNSITGTTNASVATAAVVVNCQPKMDWIQTSNTVTLFYYSLRDYPGVDYQLVQITDSKYRMKFSFEKELITHEIELYGAVNWPPKWKRNFESMKIEFTFTKKEQTLWKSYGTYTTIRETKTNQRTYKEYRVVSNTSLCKLVKFIVLRAEKYLEIVPIGRHVEARLNIMGIEVSRMYTPVPAYLHIADMAPGYDSDCICLMVKIYPDGALTPTMTTLKPGQFLTISNSLGTFTAENFQDFSIIHMLAAGTGLTAMLPNIQWALGRRNVSRINLLNFNRNEDNVFYANELNRVSTTEKRFNVTHILSHPNDSWKGRQGEISTDLLKELLGLSSDQACIFICGPGPFMQLTKAMLFDIGWKSNQLHEFDD